MRYLSSETLENTFVSSQNTPVPIDTESTKAENMLQIEIDASELIVLLAKGQLAVKQFRSLNPQTKRTLWLLLLKSCVEID